MLENFSLVSLATLPVCYPLIQETDYGLVNLMAQYIALVFYFYLNTTYLKTEIFFDTDVLIIFDYHLSSFVILR